MQAQKKAKALSSPIKQQNAKVKRKRIHSKKVFSWARSIQ